MWRDNIEVFSFTIEEETKATADTGMPTVEEYLYEPSPATMKAAPFKLLSQRFDMSQLSNNTHLYISSKVCPQFPGTGYIIEEILPYSSSNIKKLARLKLKADVAVRNFTISAEALGKKLNIRQSGPLRIMGVTLADNNPYLLLLKKL